MAIEGELFALQLRLSPTEPGEVRLNTGTPAQAAFLDLVRQVDPNLAERLHADNQRRPYTLGMLQGFNHLTEREREAAMAGARPIRVESGQVFWLRLTILDGAVFQTFTRALLAHAADLRLRIGGAQFTVTRVLGMPEAGDTRPSWVGFATFADLAKDRAARHNYHFEFATPTAFSLGQRSWGKAYMLFPDPAHLWRGLARAWEEFAPEALRLAATGLAPHDIEAFCAEHVVVSRYEMETRYLPAARFGQMGFQGTAEYSVMAGEDDPAALWLTPLARFASYAGVGHKTSMGMGQTRWLHPPAGPGVPLGRSSHES